MAVNPIAWWKLGRQSRQAARAAKESWWDKHWLISGGSKIGGLGMLAQVLTGGGSSAPAGGGGPESIPLDQIMRQQGRNATAVGGGGAQASAVAPTKPTTFRRAVNGEYSDHLNAIIKHLGAIQQNTGYAVALQRQAVTAQVHAEEEARLEGVRGGVTPMAAGNASSIFNRSAARLGAEIGTLAAAIGFLPTLLQYLILRYAGNSEGGDPKSEQEILSSLEEIKKGGPSSGKSLTERSIIANLKVETAALRTSATIGKAAAAKVAPKTMAARAFTKGSQAIGKAAAKETLSKTIARVGSQTAAKAFAKSIPFIGWGAGFWFGGQRLLEGDIVGAGLEGVSAIGGPATALPALGVSIARDVYKETYDNWPEDDMSRLGSDEVMNRYNEILEATRVWLFENETKRSSAQDRRAARHGKKRAQRNELNRRNNNSTTLYNSETPSGDPVEIWDMADIDSEYLMDQLQHKYGYTRSQAAGIVANFIAESGLDPTIVGDNGTSYGLAQWHKSRRDNLFSFAKSRGMDHRSADTQLAFFNHEMNTLSGNLRTRYDQLAASGASASELSGFIRRHYEVPKTDKATGKLFGIDRTKKFAAELESGAETATTNVYNDNRRIIDQSQTISSGGGGGGGRSLSNIPPPSTGRDLMETALP